MVSQKGVGCGLLGILIFSASFPATRLAELGFTPVTLTALRAVIAAILGAFLLFSARTPRPVRGDYPALACVALGVVIGFPLFSAFALDQISAARSVVWTSLLPLSTALFGVIRGGERPSRSFWILSSLGAALVLIYTVSKSDGGAWRGDLLMIGAILLCGLGYAEGAILSRRLGGWPVIAWSLIAAFPVSLPAALLLWPAHPQAIPVPAWIGLAYVALFSMMLGFVFWYRALAQGGIARIGQLQLLQPFGGLACSALVLGEHIPPGMIGMTFLVLVCILGARRLA